MLVVHAACKSPNQEILLFTLSYYYHRRVRPEEDLARSQNVGLIFNKYTVGNVCGINTYLMDLRCEISTNSQTNAIEDILTLIQNIL